MFDIQILTGADPGPPPPALGPTRSDHAHITTRHDAARRAKQHSHNIGSAVFELKCGTDLGPRPIYVCTMGQGERAASMGSGAKGGGRASEGKVGRMTPEKMGEYTQ